MKPTLPQGTRDFAPETVRKRHYILDTIRHCFELYGFEPLETPAFENLETLMGKYGDEGDKLIFKILNNGLERSEKHEKARAGLESVLKGKNSTQLTERALKYDLTIPFARYVAMNRGQLNMPFKRYQVQAVWRADRPQRGRYREFTQCDADVVGSHSLLNEVDLLALYTEVFKRLGVQVEICINNRKILAALAETCGGMERLGDITVAIDKLDKIPLEKVIDELQGKGIEEEAIRGIQEYLGLRALGRSHKELLMALKKMFSTHEVGLQGIEELGFLAGHFPACVLDVTLARGLNYYTGTIIEVKPLGIQMGSIGGGGRYDDLTGLFDVPGIPGVGISFGVDRMYDVMEELGLFPAGVHRGLDVMLVHTGEAFLGRNLEVLHYLRGEGISAELYPDAIKFDKQMKYAHKKGVSFVVIVSETELAQGVVRIKNFATGDQEACKLEEVVELLKNQDIGSSTRFQF